jgi:hypothetical protein
MNNSNSYQGLNFDKGFRDFPKHILIQIGIPIVVIISWLTLPVVAFFWLALLLVSVLTWISSYGWQKALTALISFLQHQQRI